MAEPTQGAGYAVSSLAQMGGPGFPKVRLGEGDAVVLEAGGKDGYVGRDGQAVGGEPRGGPPSAA